MEQKNYLNPMNWDAETMAEVIFGALYTVAVLSVATTILVIFQ